MSQSNQSEVFFFDNSDPKMQDAYRRARESFRYFWREVAWERRRIVPGLDLACVKAPFTDGDGGAGPGEEPQVEHMWLSDVDFDGRVVSGVLLNAPNWLKSVKEGDPVSTPLHQISDWMYGIQGEVFGAFTVNLMRSRMSKREREEHDAAWGLNFGDPDRVRTVPAAQKAGGFLKSLFGRSGNPESEEHPMSENMASSLEERLAEDPSMLESKDDRGWTLLHHQALAGSAATVKILLDRGADASAITDHGMTPLQLARSLGWERVIDLLNNRAAR